MAGVRIVNQLAGASLSGTLGSVTLNTAPLPTDTVIVVVLSGRGSPRAVTSLTGLGITNWTLVKTSSLPGDGTIGGGERLQIWKGTNPTSAGAVTAYFSGTQSAAFGVYVLRGSFVDASIEPMLVAATSAGEFHGPEISAGFGQAVSFLLRYGSANSVVFPSLLVPSTGWVLDWDTESIANNLTIYRNPNSETTHKVSADVPNSANSHAVLIRFGELVTQQISWADGLGGESPAEVLGWWDGNSIQPLGSPEYHNVE